MTDIENNSSSNPGNSEARLATPLSETRRRRPSLVWLVPIFALVVAGAVVWNNYASRGPLITIKFDTASGIQAGVTEVRIRDLRVGIVEEVGFSGGMEAVETQVRLDKTVAQYLDADAEFWLVQPQVTARGVTGIGTLLSGVYIAANWDGEAGAYADTFTALETPPLSSSGEEGTRVVLRTRAGGQLAAGAPVLTSGIEVGRIGQPVLSASGTTVTMEAFIRKPYDQRLTTNARFWDASGLSVNVGTSGLAVKVDSLAALLEGGVNFGAPVTGGERVKEGHVFEVFPSEELAREDAFEADSGKEFMASIMLDSDVSGLGIGTLVRFRGIKVGEVEDVFGVVSEEGGSGNVNLRIDMSLSPSRLGLPKNLSPEETRATLQRRVANGLRARVAAEGLFGQTVIIELVNLASADPAEIAFDQSGRMMLPTAPAAKAEGNSGVDSLVKRVSNLPIEELMTAATEALAGVRGLTGAAQDVLSADGMNRIPQTVDQTLAEVRSLVTDIRNGGAIENLNATLESANNTLKSVEGAAAKLPDSVDETLAEARTLISDLRKGGAIDNLNATLQSATNTLKSVETAAEKIPGTVNETLAVARSLVTDLKEGGAVDNLNETLKSASSTLKSIEGASETLPETLNQINSLITDLKEGGAIANLNATLQSADSALKAVDGAANTLPALAKRLNAVADNLQAVVAGYNANSRFYKDVRGALREVSSAAESFRSLARSIERNPSSLVRGR